MVDATGDGTWTEVEIDTDGLINLRADGDVQLHGQVRGGDAGADVTITSLSQVLNRRPGHHR